jgi:tetratricopeptide (TPR) repeat protein
MTTTLVAGALAALSVLMVLRPFASPRHPALALPDADPDSDRGGELLRQLRDLDEDLAAGKLDEDDHRRMRGPVERQAAQVLRRVENKAVENKAVENKAVENKAVENKAVENRHVEDKPLGSPPPVEVPPSQGRRAARAVLPAGVVAVASVAAVLVVLSGALTPRGAGQTITGGATTVSPPQAAEPMPGLQKNAAPSPAQLAAVEAAVARVRTSPRDVGAHLDLARAYAGAGAPQLSAIEYLAVTQLDPDNAGANTQLALIAFQAGQAAQAKKLVDTALTAHPRYPEALYARGLIQLMGMRDPTAAERDLRAYLSAAPRGAHRASVETLLAITSGVPR